MGKPYVRKTERSNSYKSLQLQEAVIKVNSGEMTIRAASRFYKIPRATIFDYKNGRRHTSSGGGGRRSDLGIETECHLADCLKVMSRCGFGLSRKDVLRCVGEYVELKNIKTRFKDGIPGKDWFVSFKKKYNLTLKKPEVMESKRVKQQSDPFIVYDFYDRLAEVFQELNLYDSPARIANCDETFFCSDASKGKVVAEVNTSTFICTPGPGRQNTTVLACGFADASLMPPLIIHQSKQLWKNWMPKEAFPDTSYAHSTKGWITSDIFYDWFAHEFVPFARSRSPCLLLMDGHASHMSLAVIEEAKKENITILVLPPHLSHQLQPLDKTFFKPLKLKWDANLCKWQREHYGMHVNKREFSVLVGKCWKDVDLGWLRKGFLSTGIFPFNRSKYPVALLDQAALQRYQEEHPPSVAQDANQFRGSDGEPSSSSTAAIPSDLPDGEPPEETLTASAFQRLLLKEVKQVKVPEKKRKKVRTTAAVITREKSKDKAENESLIAYSESDDELPVPPPLRVRVLQLMPAHTSTTNGRAAKKPARYRE